MKKAIAAVLVVVISLLLTGVIAYNSQFVQSYITSYHAEKVIKIGKKYSDELTAVSKSMAGKEKTVNSLTELENLWETEIQKSDKNSEMDIVFNKLNCKPIESWQWENGNIGYYYNEYTNKYTGERYFYGFKFFPDCNEQPDVGQYIMEGDGWWYYYTKISDNLYTCKSAFFGV